MKKKDKFVPKIMLTDEDKREITSRIYKTINDNLYFLDEKSMISSAIEMALDAAVPRIKLNQTKQLCEWANSQLETIRKPNERNQKTHLENKI